MLSETVVISTKQARAPVAKAARARRNAVIVALADGGAKLAANAERFGLLSDTAIVHRDAPPSPGRRARRVRLFPPIGW